MKWNMKKTGQREKAATAGKWQARVEQGKRRLAGWLQRQSEKLSIRTKKVLLIGCCLLFGSLMVLQVVNGLGLHKLPDTGKVVKPLTPPPLRKMEPDTVLKDSTGIGNKSFNHKKGKQ